MIDATQLKEMAHAIGCPVSLAAAERLLVYLDAMLVENRKVNLTAIRERESAVLLHALDSLAAGNTTLELSPRACLDLGTGNGFPGVALACLFPDAQVVLMDRTQKKLAAITRALEAAEFDLERVRTLQMDAVAAPAHGHGVAFDVVSARAVGEPRPVGLLARPLLRTGGSFLAWMSADQHKAAIHPKAYRRPLNVSYTLPPPADRVRVVASYVRP